MGVFVNDREKERTIETEMEEQMKERASEGEREDACPVGRKSTTWKKRFGGWRVPHFAAHWIYGTLKCPRNRIWPPTPPIQSPSRTKLVKFLFHNVTFLHCTLYLCIWRWIYRNTVSQCIRLKSGTHVVFSMDQTFRQGLVICSLIKGTLFFNTAHQIIVWTNMAIVPELLKLIPTLALISNDRSRFVLNFEMYSRENLNRAIYCYDLEFWQFRPSKM